LRKAKRLEHPMKQLRLTLPTCGFVVATRVALGVFE